jgi:hypothetical protein
MEGDGYLAVCPNCEQWFNQHHQLMIEHEAKMLSGLNPTAIQAFKNMECLEKTFCVIRSLEKTV